MIKQSKQRLFGVIHDPMIVDIFGGQENLFISYQLNHFSQTTRTFFFLFRFTKKDPNCNRGGGEERKFLPATGLTHLPIPPPPRPPNPPRLPNLTRPLIIIRRRTPFHIPQPIDPILPLLLPRSQQERFLVGDFFIRRQELNMFVFADAERSGLRAPWRLDTAWGIGGRHFLFKLGCCCCCITRMERRDDLLETKPRRRISELMEELRSVEFRKKNSGFWPKPVKINCM